MDKAPETLERKTFTDGRLTNEQAIRELEDATGIAVADLTRQIPELAMQNLDFRIRWASEGWENNEVGRTNSQSVADYIIINLPTPNSAGGKSNDASKINGAYHINVSTGEIVGFQDYYAAVPHLVETVCPARLEVK